MESKEKKKKKGEDGILWVYVCGGQNAREKKKKGKRKRMDERKAKNKKSQFKILPQYFYNKF